ncbi:MAG: ABC transporter permease [Candidatus Adiutrix sp.]|nr:ABC transporter permease [Candidatus Adiutrix sp.]
MALEGKQRHRRSAGFFQTAEDLAGWAGCWGLAHLRRLAAQAGFAGRLFRLGRHRLTRYRSGLMFRLVLREISKLIQGTLPLLLTVGLIMGAAWAFIWLGGPLASLGGSLDNVTSVLITVNALVLAPILVSVIAIFGYGAATTWDLAVMKSTRQFDTLAQLGIPPEHFLAVPRLGATVLVMPMLLAAFTLVSFIGAYIVVWQYTGHSVLAFVISLRDNTRAIHFAAIILKSLVISLSLSFFSVYGGFEVAIDGLGHGSGLLSQAMAEAFFFSILTSLLVSAFFR